MQLSGASGAKGKSVVAVRSEAAHVLKQGAYMINQQTRPLSPKKSDILFASIAL